MALEELPSLFCHLSVHHEVTVQLEFCLPSQSGFCPVAVSERARGCKSKRYCRQQAHPSVQERRVPLADKTFFKTGKAAKRQSAVGHVPDDRLDDFFICRKAGEPALNEVSEMIFVGIADMEDRDSVEEWTWNALRDPVCAHDEIQMRKVDFTLKRRTAEIDRSLALQ